MKNKNFVDCNPTACQYIIRALKLNTSKLGCLGGGLRGIKTDLDFNEAGKGRMSKFIYSFSIILFGLSLGYLIQILARRGRIKLPIDIDSLRILLQRVALLFINPVAVAFDAAHPGDFQGRQISQLSNSGP